MLAPGHNDIVAQLAGLMEIDTVPWPEQPLWIATVRRRDGRRVVFGRPGSPDAPLHLAVSASCAIPGFFQPVLIGDHTYVDGGAHSPTNAALLRGQGLDLVVVVSPMSGPPGRPSFYAASRRHAARRLQREIAALERVGTRTVVFEPTEREQRVMGDDLMSGRKVKAVIAAAREATRETLRGRVADLLSGAR